MAVGYGQFEFTGQKGGMVCCWSLKNPEVSTVFSYSVKNIEIEGCTWLFLN